MLDVAKHCYGRLDIALLCLGLFYTVMFEDPVKKSVNDTIFFSIFGLKKAIKQYENKVMKCVKVKNRKPYEYKNSGSFEQPYTEKVYEINQKNEKILDSEGNPITKKQDKIYIHKPFVDLSRKHKDTETNYSYHLFALYENFSNCPELRIGFDVIKHGKDEVEDYYDLNYVSIIVKDIYSFITMIANYDKNTSREDIKSYLDNLEKQYILPMISPMRR